MKNFLILAKTKTAKQTGFLYGSQIAAMAIGFIATILVTRALGPEQYGLLAFIITLVALISIFFEFGFASSTALLLANSKQQRKDQELIAAATLIGILISLSFFILIFGASFYIDSIFHTTAGKILRSVSILTIVVPFQFMLQLICQGKNAIGRMSVLSIMPRIWYLAGALIVINFFKLDVTYALIINFSGLIVVISSIILSFKPSFKNLKKNLKLILKKTKEYGMHIYIGRILAVSTYKLDGILISYFVNTTQLGFYSLALLLVNPILLLSQSLAASLFKNFAREDYISRRVIVFNLAWLVSSVIVLILLSKIIVTIFFGSAFLSTVPLIIPLAIAVFFQGMYQPYNKFIVAKGKGSLVKNIAIKMAVLNLILNFPLIYYYGAMGAAIAGAISASASYILYLTGYKKILKK